VEVHCAHGYLVDQFLKGGINDRADEYGGSIANRCKFLMEVMGAVTGAIGAGRTSARISPIIDHLGAADSDPVALGVHVVRCLSPFRLAYLHITEPRLHAQGTDCGAPRTCHVYRREYSGGVVIGSGGFTRDEAMEAVRSGYADAVSFGRAFLANPDLPLRFYLDLPLNEYDRASFYTHDPVVGYTDYPTFDQSRLRTDPLPSPVLPISCNIPLEQI
jgi:12-oxophytodienoic acid reductase